MYKTRYTIVVLKWVLKAIITEAVKIGNLYFSFVLYIPSWKTFLDNTEAAHFVEKAIAR